MPTSVARRLALLIAIAIALAVVVGGCGGDPGPSGSSPVGGSLSLANTSWIVASVNGRSPMAGAVPTITFSADSVTGTGGCNHIGGRYQVDSATGQFATRELGSTAMGCLQPGVSDFESLFLQALGGSSQAAIDDAGQLILSGPASRIILVVLIHPAPPA